MNPGCSRTQLEEEILQNIRPSALQLAVLGRLYRFISSRVYEYLSRSGVRAIIEAEGSYAKGTLLSDRWELDVFVVFQDLTREWVNNKGKDFLQEALKGLPVLMKYSEHPYVTVSLMGVDVDVVPVAGQYSAEGPKGVERTPLHTRYVRSRLNECLADDVRLLKSFMKGVGVYGAEAHVGGFSGYLAELLTINYGSFRGVLEAASRWRPPVIIDITGKADLKLLRSRYPDSPMIFVDPVDPLRNAAAAVTLEKLSNFIAASKLYLASPSPEFFHIFSRRVSFERLGLNVHAVVLLCHGDYSSTPPTDLWGRLARQVRSLASYLRERGFTVLRYSEYTDEFSTSAIGVAVAEEELPELEVLRGPPAWGDTESLLSFVSKRADEGGVALFEGYVIGVRPREERHASEIARKWAALNNMESCEVLEFPSASQRAGQVGRWAMEELLSVPAWSLRH